ncbi:MAG: sigma D regulator [Succinivibrionaceae bacterium]
MYTEYALTKLNKTRQLVAGKLKSVDAMLNAREALLLKYCTLLEPRINGTEQEVPERKKIAEFCEDIIDYMSRGHFDIYPRIVQIMETVSGKRLSIAQKIIPRIHRTTEKILTFDDKYGEGATDVNLNDFKKDLGALGESLEARFKLEDRLVIVLQILDDIMQSPVGR